MLIPIASADASTLDLAVDVLGAIVVSLELIACVYVVARGIAWWLDQQKGQP